MKDNFDIVNPKNNPNKTYISSQICLVRRIVVTQKFEYFCHTEINKSRNQRETLQYIASDMSGQCINLSNKDQ